jgi:hypothetical protein
MSTDLERLARMKKRAADQLDAEIQQATQRKKTEDKIRIAEKALANRRAFLIGNAILETKLTHEEKAVICGIMSRRSDKPADWDKVSDFTIHSVAPARSAKVEITEFARAGK